MPVDEAQIGKNEKPQPATFTEVQAVELDYVRLRRIAASDDTSATNNQTFDGQVPSVEDVRGDLAGIALSGGGIRSATFSLGVLQALEQANVFRQFDYLSTVSGGGYIGTALSVLMRKPGSPFPFTPHSPLIRHFHERSQYLGQRGLYLRTVAILLLGLTVNLLTLLPLLLAGSLVIAGCGWVNHALRVGNLESSQFWGLVLILPMWLLYRLVLSALRLAFVLMFKLAFTLTHVISRSVPFPSAQSAHMALSARHEEWRQSFVGKVTNTVILVLPEWLKAPLSALIKFDEPAMRTIVVEQRRRVQAALQRIPIAACVLAFLAVQPLVLDWIAKPHGIPAALNTPEFWAAALSIVAAAAPLLGVGGMSGSSASWLRSVGSYAIAAMGPLLIYVFCLVAASYLHKMVISPIPWETQPAVRWFLKHWSDNPTDVVLIICYAAIGYFVIPWLLFDINERSMHGFYRDRLSETFVVQLVQQDGSGKVEPEDELPLSALGEEGSPAPYHLLNTTLNLQADRAMRNRGRNGDFFVFSRDFFGSESTGYARTDALELAYSSFSAASAMATSGAAVSPSMGMFTRGPLIFTLTLLNIRLACCVPNPARLACRNLIGFGTLLASRPSPFALLAELAGHHHARGHTVYLSDGGHLENTGILQLLRRRCRRILAVDAGTDPQGHFEDLAVLKRYARLDLDTDIELDVSEMRVGPDGFSKTHFVVGRILYPPERPGDPPVEGRLIVIKSSLTGDEDLEVESYRRTHRNFPHDILSDQFFDEGQFEAYRSLGQHAGKQAAAEWK